MYVYIVHEYRYTEANMKMTSSGTMLIQPTMRCKRHSHVTILQTVHYLCTSRQVFISPQMVYDFSAKYPHLTLDLVVKIKGEVR